MSFKDKISYDIMNVDLMGVGKHLSALEYIIFRILQILAIDAYQKGIVDSPDEKITVKAEDIYYKMYGVSHTSSGYDAKQTKTIREAFTKNNNLIEQVCINKDNGYVLTPFIKYLDWDFNTNKVTFQIDIIFFKDIRESKLQALIDCFDFLDQLRDEVCQEL